MEHLKSFLKDMENKKKFEQEASEFFADKKNDNVNTLYITSDGCLFRAEHYANNWKNDLKDKTLEIHNRTGKSLVDVIIDDVKARIEADKEDQSISDSDASQDTSERDALVKEYIELFDTKPHHMLGVEKLKIAIDTKKAELALIEDAGTNKESGADQEDSGADQDKVDDADQKDNK